MNVLVAYASRHGSTADIAERIAKTLTLRGHPAEAVPVERVQNLADVQAVVIGSAAYMGKWLGPARGFVRRHRDELGRLPVWLFSSGPLGPDTVDDQGRDVLEASRPQEFEDLDRAVQPRGTAVFFGAFDPADAPVGMSERLVRSMPSVKRALPAGDFRNWQAIDDWASQIADELDALSRRPDPAA